MINKWLCFKSIIYDYRQVTWWWAPASTVALTIIWHGCSSPSVPPQHRLRPVSCTIVLLMLQYVQIFHHNASSESKLFQYHGYCFNFTHRPKFQLKKKIQMMLRNLSAIHRTYAITEGAVSTCNIMDEWSFHFPWLLQRQSKTIRSSQNGVHITLVRISIICILSHVFINRYNDVVRF